VHTSIGKGDDDACSKRFSGCHAAASWLGAAYQPSADTPAGESVVTVGPPIEFYAATPERWPDLERLFACAIPDALGNPAGCWCMEWRLPREQWRAQVGAANRLALQALVDAGVAPGVLAYRGAEAVGWCAVAPRAELVGLQAAGHFAAFDAPDVWSIVCFYIAPAFRGQGLMDRILAAAVEHALQAGASVIEAYPVDRPYPRRGSARGSWEASRRSGARGSSRPPRVAKGSRCPATPTATGPCATRPTGGEPDQPGHGDSSDFRSLRDAGMEA
jgi:GNAT superfamily N-acetyltransferase